MCILTKNTYEILYKNNNNNYIMKAILTIGVSASGKSTWAENFVQERNNQGEKWIVINQDEIRLSLIKEQKGNDIDENRELRKWDYNPEGESELKVKERWDTLVKNAIKNNYNGLVISDTNLDGGYKKINKLVDFGVDAKDISTKYLPISFEDALQRDKNRKFQVGEEVLKSQFERLNTFLEQNTSLIQDELIKKRVENVLASVRQQAPKQKETLQCK